MADKSTLEPFLMRFATDRLAAPAIGGRYCEEREVWLVTINGVERPIVQTDRAKSEMQTKTKVEVEEDDDEWSAVLELTTKTRVELESDDEEVHGLGLLEMATKTFVQVESDDEEDIRGLESRPALNVAA